MLVCSVSQRARRASIAADIAEIAAAADALGTGNIVFATLVDDPASVGDRVDAYLGEIMIEAASAADVVDGGFAFAADLSETATAADVATATLAVATATLDGAVANVTLSNGNLTATHNLAAGNSGARSTSYKSTAKYYYEATYVTGVLGAQSNIGIMTSAGTYASFQTGGSNLVTVVQRGNGHIFTNAADTLKTIGILNVGDTVGVAIDLTGRLAWFRRRTGGSFGNWNGDAAADPATGAGGVLITTGAYAPAVGFGGGGTTDTESTTVNFGASAFLGTVPSGYTAGWSL